MDAVGERDQVSSVVVTFGAIAVSWLVVALAAFSTLRSLALKVALHPVHSHVLSAWSRLEPRCERRSASTSGCASWLPGSAALAFQWTETETGGGFHGSLEEETGDGSSSSLLLRVPSNRARRWHSVAVRDESFDPGHRGCHLVVPLSTIGGDLVAHPSDDHYRGSDVLALRGSGVDHSTHGSDRSILY